MEMIYVRFGIITFVKKDALFYMLPNLIRIYFEGSYVWWMCLNVVDDKWRTPWRLLKYFKYALFDLFCAHFRQENMFSGHSTLLHENAILLVSTLQVLEVLLHVITVASRNLWLRLETTSSLVEISRLRVAINAYWIRLRVVTIAAKSEPLVASRNLWLRLVTKTW